MVSERKVSMLDELQTQIAAFAASHTMPTSLEVRCLDLVSEVGELSKQLLSTTRYGQRPFVPTEAWDAELGDVLFSLICLANQSGTKLKLALNVALDKYEERWEEKGTIASEED